MKPRFRLLLTVGLAAVSTCVAASNESPKTPSQLIPDRAAVSLEILKPAPLLDALLSPAFEARLKALPGYEGLVSGPKLRDLRSVATLFESTAHTNWQTIVRTIMSKNAALALGAGNRHLLVLTGDNPEMLRSLHDFSVNIAKAEAEKRGQADQVRSMEYEGLTGWTFNGKEAHTVISNQLLAASDAAVLKAAVDLRQAAGGSLADRTDYKAAQKAVGAEAAAFLFLDIQQLRDAPWFNNMLKQQQQNPLICLLLADVPEMVKTANWLALGAYVEKGGLTVRVFSDANAPASATADFAKVKDGGRGLAPEVEVPRQIAAFNLHRDLAAFYGAKDTLFPERTSGLIFFENMMGIFFSGRNLTDEVLAELQPQVQMVVARQEYDKKIGVPQPQVPAFALVFELRHPEKFNEVVEEAWQKALGLVNFTRGQKAEPGLILDRAEHNGNRMTLASFSAKEVEDRAKLDTRFNFRPSLALAKGRAILSSTDQLARDLLDALNKTSAKKSPAPPQAHTFIRLSGSELAGLLRANRASLVRDDMAKKGKSQEEAEAGIDIFTSLVSWADEATVTTGSAGRGQLGELRLEFSKP